MLGKLFAEKDKEAVTAAKIAKRIPRLVAATPRMVKGFYNANKSKPETPRGLGVLLEDAAKDNPNGYAIKQGERSISYQEFNAWANRIAHHFLQSGYQKGDVVAVLMDNRPELLAIAAGMAKTGIILALINTSQRDKVLTHSVTLVQAKAIILGEEHAAAFEEVVDSLAQIDVYWMPDEDTLNPNKSRPLKSDYANLAEGIRDLSDKAPESLRYCFEDDACFYFYTSGTTGLPKAARLTHGRFHKAFWGMGVACVNLDSDDTLMATLPFYHATAMVVCWSCVLSGRATLVIERKFSASKFWPTVAQHSVTAIGYVGELCRYLLESPSAPGEANNPVRLMIGNGLRPNIWRPFKERFGIDQVFELYGSSEGNIGFLNVLNLDHTVGFSPLSFAIVNYDVDEEVPVRGQSGFMSRVGSGGTGLLLGEINDRAPYDGYTDKMKTEKTILRNVFEQGDAWFNTGDLVRDLGYRHVQFVDRLGDTFRWKGENVSTTEVENTLSSIHPILEAVVYGVEIPGTNGRAGMAAVRLEADQQIHPEGLLNELRRKLPVYAVPLFIREVDTLERTATFKYRKVGLKSEAYRVHDASSRIWAWLPGTHTYQLLDAKAVARIDAGKYRY